MRMLVISLFFTLEVVAQVKPITYSNHGQALKSEIGTFYSNKIHEIILSPDATFKFWSRPGTSCFLWRSFEGTWKKDNDTLYFSDEYQLDQDDVTATYRKNNRQSFFIDFRTDEGHRLDNKQIHINYIYDYNSQLPNVSRYFTLTANNTLEIPFKDIPKYHQLSSIKIEYQLSDSLKRGDYLTTNQYVNLRQHDIPNIISVVFVERPKSEMINRVTKGVIRDGKLFIVSTEKSVSKLKDYGEDFEFENGYVLEPEID